MESDEGKLFIGGIAWDTTEEKLSEYFGQYGEVVQTVIMRDKTTGRPRGFGFVVFSDPSVLDLVLNDKHTIDGRTVEAKRALSRDEQQTSSKSGSLSSGRSSSGGGGGNFKTKKIFVGGLPPTLSEEVFRQFFEGFGQVTDVVIMYDQNTQRPRGFGFITFDTEDAVDRVLHKNFHELNGKSVEVKRALPKDANPSGGGGGGGGRGGSYQSYSGASSNSFEGRMDSNRYMQPQAAGAGFPPYSGYGAPSYGYGAANAAVSYGGYGGYGAGFPAPGGSYGNPNAPNAAYIGGVPGAMKNNWAGQTPAGYGSAGYGAAGAWGAAGGGGATPAPRGQSPSGASGYGNQGYSGYNNYSGSYGAYAGAYTSGGRTPNSGSGGEHQGGGGGYSVGGGYGENNGSSGYSNAGWRSEAPGGYGGAQSRPV